MVTDQQSHERVAGWVNEDGTRGFECSCGTVYDGLDRAGSMASGDPSADVSKVWEQHVAANKPVSGPAIRKFEIGRQWQRTGAWLRLIARWSLGIAGCAMAWAVVAVFAGVATPGMLHLLGVLMVTGVLAYPPATVFAQRCERRAHQVWDGRWSE